MNFMRFITEVYEIVKMGITCVFDSLFKDSNGNVSIIGHIVFTYLTLSFLILLIRLIRSSFKEASSTAIDEFIRSRID